MRVLPRGGAFPGGGAPGGLNTGKANVQSCSLAVWWDRILHRQNLADTILGAVRQEAAYLKIPLPSRVWDDEEQLAATQ